MYESSTRTCQNYQWVKSEINKEISVSEVLIVRIWILYACPTCSLHGQRDVNFI